MLQSITEQYLELLLLCLGTNNQYLDTNLHCSVECRRGSPQNGSLKQPNLDQKPLKDWRNQKWVLWNVIGLLGRGLGIVTHLIMWLSVRPLRKVDFVWVCIAYIHLYAWIMGVYTLHEHCNMVNLVYSCIFYTFTLHFNILFMHYKPEEWRIQMGSFWSHSIPNGLFWHRRQTDEGE